MNSVLKVLWIRLVLRLDMCAPSAFAWARWIRGKTDTLAMRPLRMVAEQDVQAHVDDSTAGIGCIECGFVRALCCVRLVAEHCYVRLVAEQRVVSAW